MSDIREFFKNILQFVFPSDIKCIFCDNEVNENEFCVCDSCANMIEPCDRICETCGAPVHSEAKLCITCLNNKREFEFARSPLVYYNKVKNAIHAFKYDNKKYLAKHFAKLMLTSYNELVDLVGEFDFLLPVPLHKDREKQRGYNQATLIANELSKLINLVVETNIIIRKENTTSQTTFTRAERIKNMESAFEVVDKNKIKDKKILIVDDVLTTGATTESIAKILKKNKAKCVCVISFARVDLEKNKP